ncbi:MAG TPA: 2-oxoglutarate ferredoxin oxidoreductase subunit alpha, partial [Sorangium sp.]|nr:2-oxoglutarate ferredoxin oxidoreductase subunit alpha [Sorangium sp.]
NGESPMPIIAAMTPSDCFYAAIEATRIAVKYMTPVMLLTDGYLANGSEPWKLPKESDLIPFPTTFRTDPDNFRVYDRDETTLARDWVKPGTPGLAHRVGGLEKDAKTGNVSYDPTNHDYMCRIRLEKAKRVQNDMGDLILHGDGEGDVLVVGWGSTYGAITKAVSDMRAKGYKVSNVHLRWVFPFNPQLGPLLKKFNKVVVPEMNLGQLVKLLRAEFLVDAEPLNKMQGKPFKVSEIRDAIAARASAAS